MVKVMNFIFGGVIGLLAIDILLLNFDIEIIPVDFLFWIVLALGVLILFSPITSITGTAPRSFFQWVRRWIFGIVLILMALSNYLVEIFDIFWFLESFAIGSYGSIIVLAIISLIYFLATFKKTGTSMLSFN